MSQSVSYFVTEVFRGIVFPDRHIAVRSNTGLRRRVVKQVAVGGGVLALTLLIVLPALAAYLNDADLVRATSEEVEVVATSGPGGRFEVSATGGAIVLIHRTVIEDIRTQFGDVWYDPITHPSGVIFSEDLSFCIRVAALDLPLYVHTGVKTTHDKDGVFLDEEFFDLQEYARSKNTDPLAAVDHVPEPIPEDAVA